MRDSGGVGGRVFVEAVLGGCTFRDGIRRLAFPVNHKTLPSQQNGFRKYLCKQANFTYKTPFSLRFPM